MPADYPPARRLDLVETLHGRQVADPYRWLEDPDSEETEAWSSQQDGLLRDLLGTPSEELRRRLRARMPGVVTLPTPAGDRIVYGRRRADQEHLAWIVREPDGTERTLVDPAELDPSLTTVSEVAVPSLEGDRLAYLTSSQGREIDVFHVIDVATGEMIDGPIELGRAMSIAWLPGGEELIYVRRMDEVPPEEEQYHRRVWRRRLGTPTSEDRLLFGEGRDKSTYYLVRTSADGRWLAIAAAIGTAPRNDLYVLDLSDPGATPLPVHENEDCQTAPRFVDGRLWLHTDRGAPHWRLCVADPARPQPEHWAEVLPETHDPLVSVAILEGSVAAVRTRDVVSRLTVHDLTTGEPRYELELPGLGTAGVGSSRFGGRHLWVEYTDFTTPTTLLHHHLDGPQQLDVLVAPDLDLATVTTTQVFVTSKDGTRVPMFLIGDTDTTNGPRPTVLYGYGGFDIALQPAFGSLIAAWVESGGVWAVANLRGGSEYGNAWHEAGMRANKQNVFDDFRACAEHLLAEGISDTEHLAVAGGSNGGLLVGAALTQFPELLRAAHCSAPLLDMVRYERFGLGVTWNDEYGRADDGEEFAWLIGYSPYHHVVEGTRYPATIFTVFEGDTRVDTLHARKMCAALQHATSAPIEERPILIRRETGVGHSTRAVARTVDLNADVMTFLAAQLGLTVP